MLVCFDVQLIQWKTLFGGHKTVVHLRLSEQLKFEKVFLEFVKGENPTSSLVLMSLNNMPFDNQMTDSLPFKYRTSCVVFGSPL